MAEGFSLDSLITKIAAMAPGTAPSRDSNGVQPSFLVSHK
ncbi:Uncharacterised protein [Vibrio cholerae]|nr:Uncharacterised protein [Vibrio cholerae]